MEAFEELRLEIETWSREANWFRAMPHICSPVPGGFRLPPVPHSFLRLCCMCFLVVTESWSRTGPPKRPLTDACIYTHFPANSGAVGLPMPRRATSTPCSWRCNASTWPCGDIDTRRHLRGRSITLSLAPTSSLAPTRGQKPISAISTLSEWNIQHAAAYHVGFMSSAAEDMSNMPKQVPSTESEAANNMLASELLGWPPLGPVGSWWSPGGKFGIGMYWNHSKNQDQGMNAETGSEHSAEWQTTIAWQLRNEIRQEIHTYIHYITYIHMYIYIYITL